MRDVTQRQFDNFAKTTFDDLLQGPINRDTPVKIIEAGCVLAIDQSVADTHLCGVDAL